MVITKRTKSNPVYAKVYLMWYNMIRRCHNKNYPQFKNYGGNGVYVSDRWRVLDNFIEDVDKIDGFDLEGILEGKLSLDKDSKIVGNKEYSVETCSFVSLEENNKVKPNQQKSFQATSPEGESFEASNQSKFARDNGLSQTCISECLNRKRKTHKGWKFKYN